MLKNGYIDGVLDFWGEDSRAETGSGGFGTRWANGSLGFAMLRRRHARLSQKELVSVPRVRVEPRGDLDLDPKKRHCYLSVSLGIL